MLTDNEIMEIREHLEKAQNPLFFYDNDVDGLASFLLLARAYGKGKGVAIKTGPDLNSSYIGKIGEFNPDYIFVLDKPYVSREFLDEVKERHIPIVWIDHHNVKAETEGVYYYNSATRKNGNEPVTYIAWKISRKSEDMWIAMAGCIADNYVPDFSEDFGKKWPELWKNNIKLGLQAFYETGVGRIARILNFCLKDKTSNVVSMVKFMLKVSSAQEVTEENEIFSRFKYIEKKYIQLIEKARKFAKGKLVYFEYAGELSISSDIANELLYRFPEKTIIVVFIKGSRANVSIRGKGVRILTEKAVSGLKNATGGGHEDATGAKVDVDDLPEFKRRMIELL